MYFTGCLLTTEEVEWVSNISFQCIYQGGKAVSRARNLYHIYINDSIEFDDSTICASSSRIGDVITVPKNQNNEKIKIYPNPTDNFVTLECVNTSGECENIILEIFDFAGRLVMSKSIFDINGTKLIDVTILEPGVYIMKVKSKSNVMAFHKLNIVR